MRDVLRDVFTWTPLGGELEIQEGRPPDGVDLSRAFPLSGRLSVPEFNRGPFLVIPPGTGYGRPYQPLRRPTLPSRFSRIQSPGDILAFANRNGTLTHLTPFHVTETPEGRLMGEPVALWLREAEAMRMVLNLIEAMPKAGKVDTRILSQAVRWADGDQSVRVHGRLVATAEGMRTEAIKLWTRRKERLSGPAGAFIADTINDRLGETVHTFVTSEAGFWRQPNDLLAALWLMVAQAYTGYGRQPIECVGCGQPFVPVHGRQKHCSPACRARAYRQRKLNAGRG